MGKLESQSLKEAAWRHAQSGKSIAARCACSCTGSRSDGLYALAKHVMHPDPLSGHLFAFINRRATQIRVLYFDRSGLCVWDKRLEQGRFVSDWAAVASREMGWTGLKLVLEGIFE